MNSSLTRKRTHSKEECTFAPAAIVEVAVVVVISVGEAVGFDIVVPIADFAVLILNFMSLIIRSSEIELQS